MVVGDRVGLKVGSGVGRRVEGAMVGFNDRVGAAVVGDAVGEKDTNETAKSC